MSENTNFFSSENEVHNRKIYTTRFFSTCFNQQFFKRGAFFNMKLAGFVGCVGNLIVRKCERTANSFEAFSVFPDIFFHTCWFPISHENLSLTFWGLLWKKKHFKKISFTPYSGNKKVWKCQIFPQFLNSNSHFCEKTKVAIKRFPS